VGHNYEGVKAYWLRSLSMFVGVPSVTVVVLMPEAVVVHIVVVHTALEVQTAELEVHIVEGAQMAEVEVHIGDIGMPTVIVGYTIDYDERQTTMNVELAT
jgi:hypothetical protein